MIVNYFNSTCRIIVDEFNELLRDFKDEEIKIFANEKFCEADFVFKLGTPFRHLARYNLQGTRSRDIKIDYNNFEVEVKYWRNWISNKGTNKGRWKEYFDDGLKWLFTEMDNGSKGKKALIIGWFTVFEWRELIQLGMSTGSNPKINLSRLNTLPFLHTSGENIRDVTTNYTRNSGTLSLPGFKQHSDWYLFGNANDKFNIVIYC